MNINNIKNYILFKDGKVVKNNGNIKFQDKELVIIESTSLMIEYQGSCNDTLTISINPNVNLELIEIININSNSNINEKIIVNEDSNLNRYLEVNNENNFTYQNNIEIKTNASYKSAYVDLSDGNTDASITCNLVGGYAQALTRLACLSANLEDKHYQITINHNAPNTYGNMDNYGVVENKGRLIIDGIGRITKGMKQSKTHQINKIIVFDKDCKAQANPYLYIDEFDVDASHGASVGKIDESQLYYLMSRGLTKNDAMHLVTYGYFMPIMEYIDNVDLREHFKKTLEEKVNYNV
ncbi:MAG: SufD family Fe-S cluster assembly protein [Thomasclavelia sp.]|nr:SufD family Fe-S cluster assembly protein [Thomasclavelia sp.]